MTRTLVVSLVTGLNLALAVGIQFYIFLRFGAGPSTDAHVASQTLLVFAGSLLTTTIPQALVPVLLAERATPEVTWKIMWSFALIAAPIVAFATITAGFWVPWLFPGFDAPTLSTTIVLTQIQLSSVLISAMLAAPLARLYADRRVLTSELAFLGASILTVAALPALTNGYAIVGASIALLLRALLQLLFVLPVLGPPRFVPAPRELRRAIWQNVRPLLLGAPIAKLGPVVDRLIGAMTPTGHLTLLVYGQHAWAFGLTILDRTMSKPFLATESRLLLEERKREARAIYLHYVRLSAALAVAGVVGFWLIGDRALLFLASVTRLSTSDAATLYTTCLLLGGLAIAGAPGQIAAAATYALRDTASVTRIGILSFAVATAVKIALLGPLGISGIAIGAVCYQAINLVVLHRHVMRETR
jgi:peptidoglycan biosynthesis protein MviN/MurJ (putative lipid II flippase)